MMGKYVLTNISKEIDNFILYRIKATKNIFNKDGKLIVAESSLGGFIESESNLSQDGICWVAREACVFNKAIVKDDALVTGNAVISGESIVSENSIIAGNAIVKDSLINGKSRILENSKIENSIIEEQANICGNVKILNSTISGNAIIIDSSSVEDSKVTNYVIVRDSSSVTDNSHISGHAVIGGSSSVVNSNVSGHAYIIDDSTVHNSKICDNVVVSNNAKIKQSDIKGTSRIGKNSDIYKSSVSNSNITCEQLFKKDSRFYVRNIDVANDTDLRFANILLDSKWIICCSEDKYSIEWPPYLNNKFLLSEKEFYSLKSIATFMYSLKPMFCFKNIDWWSIEEKCVQKYLLDLFPENIINISSLYSEKFFDFITNNIDGDIKTKIILDKCKLVNFFKEYFFFQFVKLYLTVAFYQSNGVRPTKEIIILMKKFFENSNVDIAEGKIVSIDADILYNNEIIDFIDKIYNFPKSILSDIYLKLKYRKNNYLEFEVPDAEFILKIM